MTSKEFQRKINFFRPYASAAIQFLIPSDPDPFIFRVQAFGVNGESFHLFESEISPARIEWLTSFFPLASLYFDRFTYSDFLIQLRYFKSFVSSCTDYQKQVLKSDSDMNKLLEFANESNLTP